MLIWRLGRVERGFTAKTSKPAKARSQHPRFVGGQHEVSSTPGGQDYRWIERDSTGGIESQPPGAAHLRHQINPQDLPAAGGATKYGHLWITIRHDQSDAISLSLTKCFSLRRHL